MKTVSGISSLSKSPSLSSGKGPTLFSARVSYTILNDYEYPEIFKKYGEWSSIGGVLFSSNRISENIKDIDKGGFAKPLFPNYKIFPLKNELVYIIAFSNDDSQSSLSNSSYYYFQPINLWNSPHHNALPDPVFDNILPPTQTKDYSLAELGNVRRTPTTVSETNLGKNFKEKDNIKSLQPFEGDIIYEGRWGQSIRFGSTILNSNIPWSQNGKNGDSIIIIRNGQYSDNKEAWIPQIEDVNKDISSIYLTSNQIIPVEVSSKNYKSYNSPPTSPEKYLGEQIIINSGRLLFNSKQDSILLSAKQSINLNSQKSVNIDVNEEFIVNSPKVLLGDKSANESVILGDKFLNDLKDLLINLISLSTSLQTPIGTPTPYVPNVLVNIEAVKTQATAQSMLNQIEKYKSQVSKTI
jgi:hypothetical protein